MVWHSEAVCEYPYPKLCTLSQQLLNGCGQENLADAVVLYFENTMGATIRNIQPATASGRVQPVIEPKPSHLDVATECIKELTKVAAGIPDPSQVCILAW